MILNRRGRRSQAVREAIYANMPTGGKHGTRCFQLLSIFSSRTCCSMSHSAEILNYQSYDREGEYQPGT